MAYPPLLTFTDEASFESHYTSLYCASGVLIKTFDGISVKFNRRDFRHLCYQDTDRDNFREDFRWDRAVRLEWIKHALEDANADLFFGWITKNQKPAYNRRVALVETNYTVTIQLRSATEAVIVTAFPMDTHPLRLLKTNEPWSASRARW